MAAVDSIGPRASQWADRIRTTYPAATEHGLARLAVSRFARTAAGAGMASCGTGLLAPLAEFATLGWTSAGVILHLAAAYGFDPADPARAVDLLVLTRVHPNAEVAAVALTAAMEGAEHEPHPIHRAADAAWRLAAPTVAPISGWLAIRALARFAPGSLPLAVGATDAAFVRRLAHRAIAHYRTLDLDHGAARV